MKAYQDHDPLHGHGKAIPHAKRPTSHTYRGGRYGTPVTIDRSQLQSARKLPEVEKATIKGRHFGLAALLAICAGIGRGAARNR